MSAPSSTHTTTLPPSPDTATSTTPTPTPPLLPSTPRPMSDHDSISNGANANATPTAAAANSTNCPSPSHHTVYALRSAALQLQPHHHRRPSGGTTPASQAANNGNNETETENREGNTSSSTSSDEEELEDWSESDEREEEEENTNEEDEEEEQKSSSSSSRAPIRIGNGNLSPPPLPPGETRSLTRRLLDRGLLMRRNRQPSYAHLFPPAAESATPIENHGIIGNLYTTALVSTEGSVVWYCYPHHDSPPLFYSLLDQKNGGEFTVSAACDVASGTKVNTKQLYNTDTNILSTRFFCDNGVGHLADFMPCGDIFSDRGWIVRELSCVRGKIYFEVTCRPTFNFGRTAHRVSLLSSSIGALFHSESGCSMLLTSSRLRRWKLTEDQKGATTKVKLDEGQRMVFVLREWREEEEKQKWEQTKRRKELKERQRRFVADELSKLEQENKQQQRESAERSEKDQGAFHEWDSHSTAGDNLSSVVDSSEFTAEENLSSSPTPPLTQEAAEMDSPVTRLIDALPPPALNIPDTQETIESITAANNATTNKEEFGTHCIKVTSTKVTDRYRSHTTEYWRAWLCQCNYEGRWRETIRRSALLLKLFTFKPTGAIIQGATIVPGDDARVVHLREASLAASAFLRLGFRNEASEFMSWLSERCEQNDRSDGSLQLVYGIRGERDLKPHSVPNVAGYMNSGPVHTGTTSASRNTLDVYGTLLIAIYLSNKYAEPISYELFRHTRAFVNYITQHWMEADEGPETIGSREQTQMPSSSSSSDSSADPPRPIVKKHFVLSKLGCWVAVDRGLKLAHERSFPAPFGSWKRVRDEIYSEIQNRGYNAKLKCFVQSYESDTLDAGLLLMPITALVGPNDPRFISTLETILKPTDAGGLRSNNLIHRTNAHTPDGKAKEITTSICTFWAIEACTRCGFSDPSYLNKARLLMEQMIGYANHVGLFSECIGIRGNFLGTYPHLPTHVALLRSILYLDLALHRQEPNETVQSMIDEDLPILALPSIDT